MQTIARMVAATTMLKRMPNYSESLRQDQPEQVDLAAGTGAMGPGGVSRWMIMGDTVEPRSSIDASELSLP